jgi:arginase
LTSIGDKTPLLNQYDITQIGIRAVDQNEKIRLTESRLKICDMAFIDQHGMAFAIKKFIEPLKKEKTHIHVSFDVDVMDDTLVPGVGTPEPGGLTYREARQIFEALFETGCVGSFDIYEINPALDHQNKTAKLAADLTTYLMGRKLTK